MLPIGCFFDLLISLLKLPYYIFIHIAMGSKKRKIKEQMFEEVGKIYSTLVLIADKGIIDYTCVEELQKRSVDLSTISETFIKLEIQLYKKTRETFDQYVERYILNPDGTSKQVLEDNDKAEAIDEAETTINDLLKFKDSHGFYNHTFRVPKKTNSSPINTIQDIKPEYPKLQRNLITRNTNNSSLKIGKTMFGMFLTILFLEVIVLLCYLLLITIEKYG